MMNVSPAFGIDDIIGLVAVVLIFGGIPLLVFLGAVFYMIFGRRGIRRNRPQEEAEMRTMQQINEGLGRLADRVDALETLMMDRVPRPEEQERAGRHEP